MKNMADAIESFIVGQLLAASKNTVLVQRNELADRLSCAPSQISYVLSTRFTCLWKNSRKNRPWMRSCITGMKTVC